MGKITDDGASVMIKWFAMGGYASFIWPAYGIVCGVLVFMAGGCLVQKRRIQKSLQLWFKQSLKQ